MEQSRRGCRLRVLAAVAIATLGVVTASSETPVEAAVVRPFSLDYNAEVFGDFIKIGNGSSVCPGLTAPTDPFGEPKSTCATAQAASYTAAGGINDSYYMQWADVDESAATFSSSSASVTIPPGASVAFARLTWTGDTGTIRLADGTVSPAPGCNTRQFLAGAGTAVLPSGTPESTATRITVGAGSEVAISPQVISRDSLANVPNSQPQFYVAHADVTAQLSTATSGTPTTVTVGNVWTPQGFGCYSGWSLTVVYSYPAPDPTYAPSKREIFLYDGHVRQSSADPTTTVTLSGFRAATTDVRVGLTAGEGDFNISGDRFSINGVNVTEPSGGSTTNFFISNADGEVSPNVARNLSIDAKSFAVSSIGVGDTSAQLGFSTSGDTYVATSLVMSVLVPALYIEYSAVGGGPFQAGSTVTYVVTAVALATNSSNSLVSVPTVADCDRDLGTLLAGVPVVYTCTGAAPADSFTSTATLTGTSDFGDPMTVSATEEVAVAHPHISITKSADKASYVTGDDIVFTVTVTNDGDTTLTNVTVTDDKTPGCDTTIASMAASASTTYTCTATAPIAGGSNTVNVTATDPFNAQTTATATSEAPTYGSVSGKVFSDRNNSGTVDADDSGIAGVTVTLNGTTANSTPVMLSTTTDSSGSYSFTSVVEGTYEVTETQPAGFDDGTDSIGTAGGTLGSDSVSAIELAQGVDGTGYNFAERPSSSISGRIFVDPDTNGSFGGTDTGLAGITVTLTGSDADGHAVLITTTSAAGGVFTLDDLRAGTYTVTAAHPVGYADGIDTAGTSGGTLSPPNAITLVNLANGTDATGYLFPENIASLTGAVFIDTDGDGSQDNGEPGIAGVSVQVTGAAEDSSAVDITVVTEADGTYAVTGLLAGTYTISETQPVDFIDGTDTAGTAGGTPTSPDDVTGILLEAGSTGTGYVFGELPATLSGTVFHDANNDDSYSIPDLPITGVSVRLVGTSTGGTAVDVTVQTDVAGIFEFTNVRAGTYTLSETQPTAYGDGTDTVGTAGGTHAGTDTFESVIIGAGTEKGGYLFAEASGSLSGTVYVDSDGDASLDSGESGIADVVVTVTGTDVNSNPVVQAIMTGSTGTYTFDDLLAGEYTITETQPAGYADGLDTIGTASGTLSPADGISAIALTPGSDATGYLFGETLSSVSGTVFVDKDGNDTLDSGEAGISGVAVQLVGIDDNMESVDVVTATDEDGVFVFDNVLSGSYSLVETQPMGYDDGNETAGTSSGLAAAPDSIVEIILASGFGATGYTFAETTGSLSGLVFDDVDGDDVLDAGESGISGVTIDVSGTDANSAPVSRSTVTASDGSYVVAGLLSGTYVVAETQPAGYTDGNVLLGSVGGTLGADVVTGVTLEPGVDAVDYSFTEHHDTIGDRVWMDDDADGVQDAGEHGIAGLGVVAYDSNGHEIASTVTGADGGYSFGGLAAGEYRIGVEHGDTLAFTHPDQGTDATDSDVDWVTGRTGPVTVDFTPGAASHRADVDAGLIERHDDISVTIGSSHNSVTVGESVTTTITSRNNGNSVVANAVMTIDIPSGFQSITVTSPGWDCTVTGQHVECTTGRATMPGEDFAGIQIDAVAMAASEGTVTVSLALHGGLVDVDTSNNNAAAGIAVVAAPVATTVPATTEPATTVVTPVTDPAPVVTTPLQAPPGELPETGTNVLSLVFTAGAALVAGLMIITTRRRRARS